MSLSRIRQDDEEMLRDSLPYHWLKGLTIHPGSTGGGRRGGEYFCHCPACGYEMSIEEGQKCNQIECPRCGTRLRSAMVVESKISQNDGIPIVPALLGLGFMGLLGFLIAKRPFG